MITKSTREDYSTAAGQLPLANQLIIIIIIIIISTDYSNYLLLCLSVIVTGTESCSSRVQ